MALTAVYCLAPDSGTIQLALVSWIALKAGEGRWEWMRWGSVPFLEHGLYIPLVPQETEFDLVVVIVFLFEAARHWKP